MSRLSNIGNPIPRLIYTRVLREEANIKRILLFIFISLFLAKAASATPIYGPKLPGKKKAHIGLQTYSIFNRYLEKEYGRLRSLQNFFNLSYGITDWFSLDLKIGSGDVRLRGNTAEPSHINDSSNFAGGYGFRARILNGEKSKIIFGFQHISVHPDAVFIGEIKNESILDDWQWSLLASYMISKAFTPYIGTRWSRMDNIHRVNEARKREKSDLTKSVGLILGTDISINKKTWLNLEGQFFDATAAAASINYAF